MAPDGRRRRGARRGGSPPTTTSRPADPERPLPRALSRPPSTRTWPRPPGTDSRGRCRDRRGRRGACRYFREDRLPAPVELGLVVDQVGTSRFYADRHAQGDPGRGRRGGSRGTLVHADIDTTDPALPVAPIPMWSIGRLKPRRRPAGMTARRPAARRLRPALLPDRATSYAASPRPTAAVRRLVAGAPHARRRTVRRDRWRRRCSTLVVDGGRRATRSRLDRRRPLDAGAQSRPDVPVLGGPDNRLVDLP